MYDDHDDDDDVDKWINSNQMIIKKKIARQN